MSSAGDFFLVLVSSCIDYLIKRVVIEYSIFLINFKHHNGLKTTIRIMRISKIVGISLIIL